MNTIVADDILDRAIKKREALAAEIRKLDQFISTYRMLAASDVEQPTRKSGTVTFGGTNTAAPQYFGTGSPPGSLKLTQEEAAVMVLDEYGPMPAKEIVFRLEAMGFKVGGKDPAGNLSSVLSHSKRVRYDKDARRWISSTKRPKFPDEPASGSSAT